MKRLRYSSSPKIRAATRALERDDPPYDTGAGLERFSHAVGTAGTHVGATRANAGFGWTTAVWVTVVIVAVALLATALGPTESPTTSPPRAQTLANLAPALPSEHTPPSASASAAPSAPSASAPPLPIPTRPLPKTTLAGARLRTTENGLQHKAKAQRSKERTPVPVAPTESAAYVDMTLDGSPDPDRPAAGAADRELWSLAKARAQLKLEPEVALAQIIADDHEFADGRLVPERLILRVRALLYLRRPQDAALWATEVRRRFGGTPYAREVAGWLTESRHNPRESEASQLLPARTSGTRRLP